MFGQMTNRFFNHSLNADYLQFDICGLNNEEALQKLLTYKQKNEHLKKIILHGDWNKKGASENNIEFRYKDYIEIINSLKNEIEILGITIHPPFRKKVPFDDFINYCKEISKFTSVFIENRSDKRIYLSNPNEIIEFSKIWTMTIDLPQLYIGCGYNNKTFLETLTKIQHDKVSEYHLANLKVLEKNTFVARKLDDSECALSFEEIFPFLNKNACFTLEIFGGNNTFDNQVELIKKTLL